MKQRYLVFARAVDAYSTHLYVEWEQRVGAVATDKLKQPILCSLAASRGLLDNAPDGAVPGKAKAPVHQQAGGAVPADSKNSGMPPPPYGVNFALELHMIIRESKYLDRMGFQVIMTMRVVWSVECTSSIISYHSISFECGFSQQKIYIPGTVFFLCFDKPAVGSVWQ